MLIVIHIFFNNYLVDSGLALTKDLFILQNIGIWQNYGVNFIQKWNRIQLRTSYFHPAIFLRQKLYKNSIAQKGKKFWVLEEIESGEDWELCAPLLHKQKHIKQKKSRLFHLLTVSLTAAMHSGTWCRDTLSVNKQDLILFSPNIPRVLMRQTLTK